MFETTPVFLVSDINTYIKSVLTTDEKLKFIRVKGVRWFTNIEHGQRHEILQLDTMAHNLKYNKSLRKKLANDYGLSEYPRYDNYDAIEVPFTECIPSDYYGVMGVPITFLDKYNPDQFKLLDTTERWSSMRMKKYSQNEYREANDMNATWIVMTHNNYVKGYKRLLISPKKEGNT